jgi:SAM-dependent methyltransferase
MGSPPGYGRELADNLKLWNEWATIHIAGSFYEARRFVEDPNDVRIEEWERREVGDVTGKTLLHLQCHFGLDTLSWARLGAAAVTGVDFSSNAIEAARDIASRTGLSDRARFFESNIYDLPGPLEGETFDLVYTSRGCIGWLPDLGPWASLVGGFVKPGGIFYMHEGHPVLWALADEQDATGSVRLGFDYWGGTTLTAGVQGSYADRDAHVEAEVEHGWNHSLGEIVTLLASNGLTIEMLDEKRTLRWEFPGLVLLEDGSYGFPPGCEGNLPLMYSLRARKPL